MNREDLVALVAERANVQRKVANAVVTDLFEVVAEALGDGEKVTIVGFGTFDVRDRAGRTGRNPRTGEAIEIAARRVPAFTPGKGLRDKVGGQPKAAPAKAAPARGKARR